MAFTTPLVRDVTITSPFWSQIQSCSRDNTIPAIIKAQKDTGHWFCLTWKEGHPVQPHPFWDSDVYKVLEAACYFLGIRDDPDLRAEVEAAVDMVRAAQHSDGYINSYYTVRGIHSRWTNVRDMHELYCIGHLIEACVAYESLPGSTGRLLEPVMKAVRHVASVFGPEEGKKHGYPGHQEIEIGLLRLYELTSEPLLLELAGYFITERGNCDAQGETYYDHEARARGADPYDSMGSEMRPTYAFPRDYAYQQAHLPLVKQDEIKGHSVRAVYYLAAATDYVRLTGDQPVREAVNRLWRDMVDTKMYITGGLGSMRQWEGFGPRYFLGDAEGRGCYAETCASFGLINWCARMLRLELNSEYADTMEAALYNGFLGAVGLDGRSFYYENPLATYTGHPVPRSTWFDVACCPPNVAKLLGSLGPLIYSSRDGVVAVHLWIASNITVSPTDGTTVSQKTDMPWSGEVELSVQGPSSVALALRIPGWAVSGFTCSVAGEMRQGYLHLPPLKNCTIQLHFPLDPRKVYAHPKTGKDEVALMLGPVVYCIEDVDNEPVLVDYVALTDGPIRTGTPKAIGTVDSVIPIHAAGKVLEDTERPSLYGSTPWQWSKETKELVFVPYFLRMNRGGNGGMHVWCRMV